MTALFRAIGAAFKTFDGASKVSGFIISAAIMYTGFMIRKPEMHPWFVWIFWIDPLAYAFDALLSNEFHNRVIPCVANNLIPSGPGFTDPNHQSCAGVGGAVPGETQVDGDAYLASLSYDHSNLWRNFGIIWAWWALFVAITVFSTTRWKPSSESGPSLLIPREKVHRVNANRQADEEGLGTKEVTDDSRQQSPEATDNESSQGKLIRNTSVFTWKNLSYTVKTPSGDRVLLDNVQGWVKPGMLGALMGASGKLISPISVGTPC